MKAPATPGSYEFRYLRNNGFTDVIRSNPVTVSTTSYTVSASPTAVPTLGALTISWTAPAGTGATDWVGLFATGTSNYQYLWYTFTNGATQGASSLEAPANAGSYEFRYLRDNGFTDVARSNPVTVSASAYAVSATPGTVPPGGTVTMSWIAPAGSAANDWVGLFAVGTTNYQYLWYTFTNGVTRGTVTLTAPANPGSYEFRYLPKNGFTDMARSNPVAVSTTSH